MKVYKSVTVETEVEIDLTSEDINVIMEEYENLRGLLHNLNTLGQFLKAIPDRLIVETNATQQKIIVTFLRESADRFEKAEPTPKGGD